MNIAKKYIEELKKVYYKNGGKDVWDNIEKIKEGASEENIKKLKEIFPEIFIEGKIDFDLLRQICSGGGCKIPKVLRKDTL